MQFELKQLGLRVIYVQADYMDEPAVNLCTKLGVREDLLADLNESVSRLLHTVRKMDHEDSRVCKTWTVRDVLAHITFWHESFARNLRN